MSDWVLFDFDGTLADTAHIAYEVYRRLAKRYDRPPMSEEAFMALNDISIRKRLKKHGVSPLKLPFLVRKALTVYREEAARAEPFAHVGAALETLVREGCRLGILSSNKEETIRLFLEQHGFDHFHAVQGRIPLFGKARALRRFLKKRGIDKEHTVYVGDEIRDVEAAKKAGIAVVAVGWGYDEDSLLLSGSPDSFVKSPQELPANILGLLQGDKRDRESGP